MKQSLTRHFGPLALALLASGAVVAIALGQAATTSSTAPTTLATAATTTTTQPATLASGLGTARPAAATVAPAATPPRGTSSSTPFGGSSSRESYRDRYAVLADRNMFVKERWRIVPTSERENPRRNFNDGSREARRVPPPEASYILTGIILPEPGEADGQVHAIVEDMKGGKVLRLSRGDAVARGQITDIMIDAVQYSANGQQAWVELGRDFTGAIPASPSEIYAAAAAAAATTQGGGSTTGPTSAPSTGALPLDPNNPNLSLEERMKIRRMQQLGGANK